MPNKKYISDTKSEIFSFLSEKQIYYEEFGNGMPLLLLHGNTACGKMFESIMPLLSKKYHIIVPDFLGCGQSDRCEKWPSDLWYEWSRQETLGYYFIFI